MLQLGIEHRVVEFVRKVLDGMLPCDKLVGQKIRENFQKVRFTAAKEAGDPYADLVRRLGKGALIVLQKCIEMTAKLTGDDVFPQLLLDAFLIVLGNFDNAVYIAVDVGFIDVLQLHDVFLPNQSRLNAR